MSRRLGLALFVVLALFALLAAVMVLRLSASRPEAQPQTRSDTVADVCSSCQPLSKASYRPDDIENDLWNSWWLDEYDAARSSSASWVQDPIDLALRFAGYPNPDEVAPDRVNVFYENSSTVTVVICKDGLMDDSVRAKEHRIDLVRNGGLWEIEWSGARFRCVPNRGSQEWTTDLCN